MPRRRGIAVLVGAASVAALAVFGVTEFLRGARVEERNARAQASRRADEARGDVDSPRAAGSTEASADAPAPGPSAAAHEITAERRVDGSAEVTFAGLVRIDGMDDESRLAGTLVLRGDSSSDPTVRIELPVKRGQFSGRGPSSARVRVERLTIDDREVTTFAVTWKLSSQWIPIDGIFEKSRLLHLVDEDGRELPHVSLFPDQHTERRRPSAHGRVAIVDARPSSPADSGWDSPIRFSFGTRGLHGVDVGEVATRECVVQVPGRGVELVRFAEDESEKTVVMRAPATVRARVSPWPLPTDAERWTGTKRQASVVLALIGTLDEKPRGPDSNGLPEAVRAQLSPTALERVRAAIARQNLTSRAITSPLRHVAFVDETGTATFDDVGAGDWIAWCDDGHHADESNILVRSGRIVGRVEEDVRWLEQTRFSTHAGGSSDISVRAERRSVALCAVVVRGKSVEDAATIESRHLAVDIVPLESDDPMDAFETRGTLDRKTADSVKGEIFEGVPVGLAWIVVTPDVELGLASTSTVADLVPGRNDVVVALAPLQGVQLEWPIPESDAPESRDLDTALERLERVRVRQRGIEIEPQCHFDYRTEGVIRLFADFAPLAPGRCELRVPDDGGFDHAGTTSLEVAERHITKITLRSTLPLDAGDRDGK